MKSDDNGGVGSRRMMRTVLTDDPLGARTQQA